MFTAFPEAPRREHSLSWEKSTNLCFLLFGSFRTFGCSPVWCLAHGHFCLKPVRTCCDPLRLDQNSWDLKSLLLDYSFLLLAARLQATAAAVHQQDVVVGHTDS